MPATGTLKEVQDVLQTYYCMCNYNFSLSYLC